MKDHLSLLLSPFSLIHKSFRRNLVFKAQDFLIPALLVSILIPLSIGLLPSMFQVASILIAYGVAYLSWQYQHYAPLKLINTTSQFFLLLMTTYVASQFSIVAVFVVPAIFLVLGSIWLWIYSSYDE